MVSISVILSPSLPIYNYYQVRYITLSKQNKQRQNKRNQQNGLVGFSRFERAGGRIQM